MRHPAVEVQNNFMSSLSEELDYFIPKHYFDKFFGATRSTFLCASLKIFPVVKLSYTPGVPHVRSSTAQKRLSQKVQPLPWDEVCRRCHLL